MSRQGRPHPRGVLAGGAVAVLTGAVLVWAGGAPGSERREGTGDSSGSDLSGTVTVLAAASLSDAFGALAAGFEDQHPGVQVELGLGPSSGLAAQVAAGAPADVLATADERTMALALGEAGAAGPDAADVRPEVFARTGMAVAVAAGADVTSLTDLDRDDVTFAVCRAEVPCGVGAAHVLAAADVDRPPVTFETDVRGVLTKVALGEVDAGVVYASDVQATAQPVRDGSVRAVPVPAAWDLAVSYPLVALPAAPRPDLAAAFVDHVLSDHGAAVLTDAGFTVP